ncbi:MAG: four helix bundle protein [Phycisphaerae bacterium]|jgi:four helix bundle protein
MTPEELRRRTRDFSLRIVKLASSLPHSREGDVFARQLVRCGTSVAANYRAACRARSHAEFVAKIGIVEEEADETVFWIEMAADAGLVAQRMIAELATEGREILAIITASRKTARRVSPR